MTISAAPVLAAEPAATPTLQPNAVFANPDHPSQPAPKRCPQGAFAIYYNPIRYTSANYTVTVTVTPGPTFGLTTADSGTKIADALSNAAKHKSARSFAPGAVAPTPNPLVVAATNDLQALQDRVQTEQSRLKQVVGMQVRDASSLGELQTAVQSAAQLLQQPSPNVTFPGGTSDTSSLTTVLDYVNAFHLWLVTDVQGKINSGDDPTNIVKTALAQSSSDSTGALYNNASVLDGTFLLLLENAKDDTAYYIPTSNTPYGSAWDGYHYVYSFVASDMQPQIATPTDGSKPDQNAAPTDTPSPDQKTESGRQSPSDFSRAIAFDDLGTASDTDTAPDTTHKPPDQTQKKPSTTGAGTVVAIVDCPSALTKTGGIGFAWLPYRSWQVGSTMVNGKTLYQVQTQNDQYGRFNYASGLMSFRVTNPGDIDFHITVGITSMTGGASYLAGASLMINGAVMLTGGVASASVQTLNGGYSVGEFVRKKTALTTTSSLQIRPALMITFPVFNTSKDAPKSEGTPKNDVTSQPKH
ncbi:MAG TPA: hypothetical protein VKR56_06985 [Candidatus Cybelea sp.]|nr:hypothetical protein [Candidatus Cybelea sp.]